MNKLENTPENKARFFALYLGSTVLYCFRDGVYEEATLYHKDDEFSDLMSFSWFEDNYEDYKLELTPLSQISDEDAAICGYIDNDIFCQEITYGDSLEQPEVDYLRSKGYALPYQGLSVEELVNRGWIKLKS